MKIDEKKIDIVVDNLYKDVWDKHSDLLGRIIKDAYKQGFKDALKRRVIAERRKLGRAVGVYDVGG